MIEIFFIINTMFRFFITFASDRFWRSNFKQIRVRMI